MSIPFDEAGFGDAGGPDGKICSEFCQQLKVVLH